jgi:hypothetical protein
MRLYTRLVVPVLLLILAPAHAGAEILVRWDQDKVPSPQSLGISTLVVPATNTAALQSALGQGYRVWLEVDASSAESVAGRDGVHGVVVRGTASGAALARIRDRFKTPGTRVVALEERGKWPHIRSNWVTRNKDVLQVTGRSAQPWIENNAALLRIARAAAPESTPMLTYAWTPTTVADKNEGPGLENYLVAIAEAGSFGGDLVLPLHEGFQWSLLLGQPRARAAWSEIRRHLEFYSWNLPARYRPIANIGVIAAEPMASYEVMNLLTRHNLPFEIVAPSKVREGGLEKYDLAIALDRPDAATIAALADFARKGRTVVVTIQDDSFPWKRAAPTAQSERRAIYPLGDGRVVEVLKGIADPNGFALEVRQLLGREHRVIDIWNGITVMTASYLEPAGDAVLVTVLNYAQQPLPVQLRIRGTFSEVHYESPEDSMTLLPFQHRDGYTEIVLPALRIGGRIFLSRSAAAR